MSAGDTTWGRPTVLPIDAWGTPDRGYATMRVTSPFGYRDDIKFAGFHNALDIGNARLGDAVIAARDGTVRIASNQPAIPWNYPAPADKVPYWGPSYGGNTVVIDHGADEFSQYVHLRDMAVRSGQRVRRGQLVGHVGDTGSAAPPPHGGGGHLHFGVRIHGTFVDPWPLIQVAASGPLKPEPEEEEMLTIHGLWPERWRPTHNADGGSNGVFREVPDRSAPVVARVPLGAEITTGAEIRTSKYEKARDDGDWRAVKHLGGLTGIPIGKTLYILRADWDPLTPGGDPELKAAYDQLLTGGAPDCAAAVAQAKQETSAEFKKRAIEAIGAL